ncbi:very short patch repair endonuclease [Bradyrhizobium elkanii]
MKAHLPKLLPRRKRAPLTRSEMMSRIRAKDTSPETAVRSAVHALGHRFRKNVASLPGKPDLANQSKRWAIFVHGCFWHGHDSCRLASKPKTNRQYWGRKLQRNKARDAERLIALRQAGFNVLILWECDIRAGSIQGVLKKFFSKACE